MLASAAMREQPYLGHQEPQPFAAVGCGYLDRMTHVSGIGRRWLTRISTHEIGDTRVPTEDQSGRTKGLKPSSPYRATTLQ